MIGHRDHCAPGGGVLNVRDDVFIDYRVVQGPFKLPLEHIDLQFVVPDPGPQVEGPGIGGGNSGVFPDDAAVDIGLPIDTDRNHPQRVGCHVGDRFCTLDGQRLRLLPGSAQGQDRLPGLRDVGPDRRA